MPHHTIHEYWLHRPTGQLWAVKITGGQVHGACGPLDPKEVTPAVLPHLWFHFRDVPWIRKQYHAFAPERTGTPSR